MLTSCKIILKPTTSADEWTSLWLMNHWLSSNNAPLKCNIKSVSHFCISLKFSRSFGNA